MSPRGRRSFLLAAGLAAAAATGVGVVPAGVAGQQIPVPEVAPVGRTELPPPLSISPGGAFLRSLLLPGWGHAAIGSYTRGGFYFAAQTATVFTLLRTRSRLGEAQERASFREAVLVRELQAQGATDPDALQAALSGDETLQDLIDLRESRKEQQEDLVALGIFLILLSSADAYVSAHLARFPEPLDIGASPSPTGGVDVALRISVPN